MDVKFFVDENLGIELVNGLRSFGHSNVEHLEEVFAKGTDDETWLNYLGEKGYCLITKDKKIRKNPKEKEALRKHNITAFFLGGSQMGITDIGKQLMNAWDKMEAHAKQQKKKGVAGAFIVNRHGGVEEIPLT